MVTGTLPEALKAESVSVANATPAEALKRVTFHVSLNVSNLPRSVEFYAALFGTSPAKFYSDYAKFEIDDPPLVLSLKPKRACVGGPLNHLGLRLSNSVDLEATLLRMQQVGARIGRQDDVKCCYAQQSKLWITDPDGTLWEVYVFHADVPDWGEKHKKIKLWSAPLKAFGIRGMLRRWWRNAFGARHEGDRSSVDFESPIPEDACPIAPEAKSEASQEE